MNNSNSAQLVVCSVMVKPVRSLITNMVRTWVDQIVRVPVHTFVVEESKIPLDPTSPDGYWYCAGDFCDIDDAGVYQHLSLADVEYAKCLVTPNIKNDDPLHSQLVIEGEYGVHYVCHNITNRVLYSTILNETLVDLDISTTGYEVVVKSTLGVYGQNRVEWDRRKKSCIGTSDNLHKTRNIIPSIDVSERTRDKEILKIHIRACKGDVSKAERLTNALKQIDSSFYLKTQKLVAEFDGNLIDFELFNTAMVDACNILFLHTIQEVGLDMAKNIYPNCVIDNYLDEQKKYLSAR